MNSLVITHFSFQTCKHTDPCCDGSNCLLKTWAVCRTGACCDSCLAKSSTHLCRAARHDCDAPEYCDGFGGEVSDITYGITLYKYSYIVNDITLYRYSVLSFISAVYDAVFSSLKILHLWVIDIVV